MTKVYDTAPEPAEEIIIVHSGYDVVWARWLRQTAEDAGVRADTYLVRPGSSLLQQIEVLARSGVTVVPVVTPNLVSVTLPAEGWEETLRFAKSRGLRLLPVVVGSTMLPVHAGGLAGVNLRSLDADRARQRFLAALGASPARRPATTMLDRAGMPEVRFPEHKPKRPPLRVPENPAEWFFGREKELDELRRRLTENRQAALSGPPGAGKSWLAAEYLRRYKSEYDIVAWIRAESSAMLREDLGRMGGLLGVPEDIHAGRLHVAVAEALQATDQPCLVVLDDAVPEHHLRNKSEEAVPGEKPAKLAELFPPDGPVHVVYTTSSGEWGGVVPTIEVPPFDPQECADFLMTRVPRLSRRHAEDLAKAVDGSPVALNAIGHALADGVLSADQQLALLASQKVAEAVPLTPAVGYGTKTFATLCNKQTQLLMESPEEDAHQTVALLRLLTFFAPEPIPLEMLTSEMEDRPASGADSQLPPGLAIALRPGPNRQKLLGHIKQFSLAHYGKDHDTGQWTVLGMHRLMRDAIQSQMSQDEAERDRHIVHRALVDADPKHSREPRNWRRYLQLWRQLVPSGALLCRHVGPGESCAGLPNLVANIVQALREKGELTAAAELGQGAANAWQELLPEDSQDLTLLEIETAATLWQLNRVEDAYEAASAAHTRTMPYRESYTISYIRAANLVAASMRLMGDWAGSLPQDEQAYQDACAMLGVDDIATIRAGHNLSVAYHVNGRYRDALRLDNDTYERCLAHPALGDRHTLTLHSLNNIAKNLRDLGEYEAAAQMQRQTLDELMDVVRDPFQQHMLRARKNLAVSLRKAGDLSESETLARQVYQDLLKIYGPKHYETIAAATNLANDLRQAGAYDEALSYAELAYGNSYLAGRDHPYSAACGVNKAAVLRHLGNFEAARELDEEALTLFTARLGPDHRYTLSSRVGLAQDLALAGDLNEAIAEGRQTLAALRNTCRADHPYSLQCAVNLSIDLRASGADDEAASLEAETLAAYDNTLGAEHPDAVAARGRVKGDCDVEPPTM